jgi:predicted enzyme related to lactoylglutathione lyase
MTEEGGGMSGEVVRFWLSAKDPDGLGRFYRELFGWSVRIGDLTSVEAGLTGRLRILDTGGAVPGLIAGEDEPGGIALMLEVDDVESVLENAVRRGARHRSIETFELAGAGGEDGRYVVAEVVDPEGNRIELVGAVRG